MEEQPENLDVMLSLAAVYEEQGEEQRALELVDHGTYKNLECCLFLFLTHDRFSDEDES